MIIIALGGHGVAHGSAWLKLSVKALLLMKIYSLSSSVSSASNFESKRASICVKEVDKLRLFVDRLQSIAIDQHCVDSINDRSAAEAGTTETSCIASQVAISSLHTFGIIRPLITYPHCMSPVHVHPALMTPYLSHNTE